MSRSNDEFCSDTVVVNWAFTERPLKDICSTLQCKGCHHRRGEGGVAWSRRDAKCELTLGNSRYSTELKTGRKCAGHLTAVRISPEGPACHRTTRFFSGFTSDDARVMTGRVSHKKFGCSENSEFCSRAEVGPFQRLIRGKLAAAVGAEGAPTGAVIGTGPALACEERKQNSIYDTASGQTPDRSADSRPVDGRKTCPTPTPISSPTDTHGTGLASSIPPDRACCLLPPRLCSFRLRLLIGQ